MENSILVGRYNFLIDEKNRLFIPAKLRKNVRKFVVTSGIDNCIYIYPAEHWNKIINKFDDLPIKNKSEERAFKRMFLSNAGEAEIDGQGRIVIPQTLKIQARVRKEIIIIGVGDRLEVWSRELWLRYSKKSEKIYSKIQTKLEI